MTQDAMLSKQNRPRASMESSNIERSVFNKDVTTEKMGLLNWESEVELFAYFC